jgi:putative transposase
MPRNPFQFSSSDFYHLTARTNNRDWFALPMTTVWQIMSDYLHFSSCAFGVQTLAFVLMENHFHLIAKFPEADLSQSMQYFMRETSRSISLSSHRINHVYGTRIFRSRISSQHHLRNVYKYVYRNPVEAKIVSRPEDYQYSTLHGLLGASKLFIPLQSDFILFGEGVERTLEWLNQRPLNGDREAVRQGLKSQLFKLPRVLTSLRQHPLNERQY